MLIVIRSIAHRAAVDAMTTVIATEIVMIDEIETVSETAIVIAIVMGVDAAIAPRIVRRIIAAPRDATMIAIPLHRLIIIPRRLVRIEIEIESAVHRIEIGSATIIDRGIVAAASESGTARAIRQRRDEEADQDRQPQTRLPPPQQKANRPTLVSPSLTLIVHTISLLRVQL